MEDVNLTGPEWLECIGDIVHQYRDDIESMDDGLLIQDSERVEVHQPPEKFNDRDWRTYRRLMRQEMHRRGLA